VSNLAGLGVLVTRPEPQAASLARRLADLSANVYLLPAMELRPRADRAAQRAALGPIDRFQWIIFISSNAVRFGVQLLDGRRDLKLAAVGPATAHALNHAGFRVSLVPASGFNSESLLAAPELAHVEGQRILIVRGDSGREALADELSARGASISYAQVYDRHCSRPIVGAVDAVEALWEKGAIDVITATSPDLLRCLFEILTPKGRALLTNATLLAGSARIASAARQIGLTGPLITSAAPDDDSLLQALTQWRQGTQ
jgi:uroporphyrinogen-III synthase